MKKLLFLLLLTISGYSQTLQNPTYGTVKINNNLNLAPITVNTTNGYITKGGVPFIHNFYAGANPTGGIGNNTIIGLNAGNFNIDNLMYASTFVGFEAGLNNKNGYSNTGIGYYALRLNENGFGNTALGTFVLGNSINGDQNTSVGWHSMLYRTGGSSNTGMGVDVLKENLLGNFNTAFGTNAGANNVSGDLNLFLGYAAGFNELGSSKLYISNSSTADPLIKGNFSTNSLALGGGVGNKVDIYGVGSIIKTDYKTHANALIPIIYDASNYTFNLNTSGALTINSTGAAVGLTSGNINKFEVLTASSTGGSGVNGIAVHDGQFQRMALLSGVNTASSYSWIQSTKGGVGFKPIFLNPNGGGVSIGNTTDLGTGTLNVSGNISTIAATTANHVIIKSQHDLKADLVSPIFTGNPTAPTATAGTNTTQLATTAFVTTADNLKANIASPTFTTGITTPAVNVSGATASTIALFDASKNIVSASTGTYPSFTELSYVKGVTAPIQTQINAVSRPYKSYCIKLTQTGTSAPTVTYTLENTVGTITWTRNSTGTYYATSSSLFAGPSKCSVSAFFGSFQASGEKILGYNADANTCVISTTASNGTVTDGLLSNAFIEIRVYN